MSEFPLYRERVCVVECVHVRVRVSEKESEKEKETERAGKVHELRIERNTDTMLSLPFRRNAGGARAAEHASPMMAPGASSLKLADNYAGGPRVSPPASPHNFLTHSRLVSPMITPDRLWTGPYTLSATPTGVPGS